MDTCSFNRWMIAAAVLVLLAAGLQDKSARAQTAENPTARTWLDVAVKEKHCPLTPINVPPAILQATSGDLLQQQIATAGDTLQITGMANPNHIIIKAGAAPGVVEIVFDGKPLGSFGPVARNVVQGGAGEDVMSSSLT